MNKQKLSSLISSLESGGRPKGGAVTDLNGIPSLGAEHLNDEGRFNFTNIKYIPLEYFSKLKNGLIEKKNILIVKDGATTGKVSFVDEDFPFERSAVNEHVFILKINPILAKPSYVFHYLRTQQGQKEILSDFRGATVGGISRRFVELVNVPFPSLLEQNRIAKILDKVKNMIVQRKESIHLLDELLKSTFWEMFGDPVKNEKRWENKPIQMLVFGVKNESPQKYPNRKYEYIDISSINNLSKEIEEVKEIEGNEAPSRARQLIEFEDIIVSTVRPNLNAVAMVTKHYKNPIASTGFCVLRVNESIIKSKFLFKICCSSYFINELVKNVRGANYPAVSDKQVKNVLVPVPPIKLQNRFVKVVEKVELLKTHYNSSLKELENLFGSLSQRAFSGKL